MTEARWIADVLEDLQPGARVLYVRNGVPKATFVSPAQIAPRVDGEPLRVVLEGSAEVALKGVPDALAAVAGMREAQHVSCVAARRTQAPEGVVRVLSGLTEPEMADV